MEARLKSSSTLSTTAWSFENLLEHPMGSMPWRFPQNPLPLFIESYFRCCMGLALTSKSTPSRRKFPIRFALDQDDTHASYDPEYANRLWRILLSTEIVLQEFRARFIGKSSPVHFFWGSFDLCCTRFSGRRAPPRKGIITSEAYSHECSSVGWWPGGGDVAGPAFYAYTAPEPPGCGEQPVRPAGALYQSKLHEFLLMYDDVRRATSPRDEILEFAQSTYEAGANLAGWDRGALERKLPG